MPKNSKENFEGFGNIHPLKLMLITVNTMRKLITDDKHIDIKTKEKFLALYIQFIYHYNALRKKYNKDD